MLDQGISFLEIMKDSLRNPQNPPSKHWVYVAAVCMQEFSGQSGVQQIQEARELLNNSAKTLDQTFFGDIRDILSDLLNRGKCHEHTN
ncbi:MAG: hypothetical protein WCT12_16335 [Verrucomicrobiota bacterium]